MLCKNKRLSITKLTVILELTVNFSLSGLSPFGCQADEDTMENIRKCNVRISQSEAFENISDEGKDFIQKLLLKNPQ